MNPFAWLVWLETAIAAFYRWLAQGVERALPVAQWAVALCCLVIGGWAAFTAPVWVDVLWLATMLWLFFWLVRRDVWKRIKNNRKR